jgi:hypothetical protein
MRHTEVVEVAGGGGKSGIFSDDAQACTGMWLAFPAQTQPVQQYLMYSQNRLDTLKQKAACLVMIYGITWVCAMH